MLGDKSNKELAPFSTGNFLCWSACMAVWFHVNDNGAFQFVKHRMRSCLFCVWVHFHNSLPVRNGPKYSNIITKYVPLINASVYGFFTGSCRYAKCTLGSWSSWTDTASPVSSAHCASQRRTRSYSLSWLYTERLDNCNGIQPQSCPSAHEETREKGNNNRYKS